MSKQKKRADGRYCKNVTIGRNESGSLKRKMIYANTQSELNSKVANLTQQVEKGVIIDDKGITVYNWAVEWNENYKSTLAYNTKNTYKSMINKYIQPNFENIKLKDLKQIKIKKVLNEIEINKQTSTANVFLRIMKEMLEAAVENDYIAKNVAKGLDSKKHYVKTKEPLTNEQIDIIKNTESDIQELCLCLYYTGMRIGELTQLTWSNIDFKNRFISITNEEDKTVKTETSIRKIPIVQPLYDLLAKLDVKRIKNINKEKDLVFSYCGRMYTKVQLRTFRCEYEEILGFNFTYHQLRHTCASMLYYANVGIKEAQEWLGHASSRTTLDIYTHLQEKDKQVTIHKVDEYLKSV